MINYSKEIEIAELLQSYKKTNDLLKRYKTDIIKEMAVEKVFSSKQEVSKEVFTDINNKITQQVTLLKAEKTKYSVQAESLKDKIGRMIEEDCVYNQKEKEMIFSNIGTVRCTFKKVYENKMSEEQKKDFIQQCIEDGDLDALSINEEKLWEKDEIIFQATGEHIEGVNVTKEIETKITSSR